MTCVIAGAESYLRRRIPGLHETMEKGVYSALLLDCPSCRKPHHVSMRMNTGQWTCFHCSIGGHFPPLVSLLENIPIAEALRRNRKGDVFGGTNGQLDYLSEF